MFIDYYKVLEISEQANLKEIKLAFKRQALKLHPDRNPDIDTTKEMQELNEAFLILKDTDARKRYDIEYQMYNSFKSKLYETSNNFNKGKAYEIKDDILKQWINNAKEQAIELTIQTIEDFKEITLEASKGCVSGLKTALVYTLIVSFLFILGKTCN